MFCCHLFSQCDNNSNIVNILQHKYNLSWAILGAHFNLHLTAEAKMSLGRAQNIFMAMNITSVVLLSSCGYE